MTAAMVPPPGPPPDPPCDPPAAPPSGRPDASGRGGAAPAGFRQEFGSSPEAVRRVLIAARAWMESRGIDAEAAGSAEIVLAEALNNVVEHAYGPGQRGGWIALAIDDRAGRLAVAVTDAGTPLPGAGIDGAALPGAEMPSVAPGTDRDALPEGGFGWALIQSLAPDVAYSRAIGCNRLTLTLPR